ncbi:MAG: DUF3450 family protein [Opitutaceae bacterium]
MDFVRIQGIRFLTCLASLATLASLGHGEDSLESIEKVARDWAQTRKETVRELDDWRWQKTFLESTREALNRRTRTLEDRREYLLATSSRLRESYVEMGRRNEEAMQVLEEAGGTIDGVIAELKRLRAFLPPRLSSALEYAYQSLEDSSRTLGERMQSVASIFNRCSQFNNAITYAEEVLAMAPGEEPRYVSVLYWGLSHGYAIDSADGVSYLGSPIESGWTWERRPDIAGAVSRLMSIYHDKAKPDFVPVPVQVSDPADPDREN